VTKPGAVGAVLAGGRSQRMGGPKATVELAGRPLIAWPLEALRAVLEDIVVVAKASTPLPELDVAVWLEPEEPRHPRAGIVHALERADGRAVLICAADLPLITPLLVRTIAHAAGTPAVVPRAGGRLQPLFARYEPEALAALRAAPRDEALTATVEGLRPRVLEIADAAPFVNANTPEELAEIAQRIARQ
jgi:molybdenum cofactor guanylyltransferase